MEGYKWLILMVYSQWNEFGVYNAGILTFYALYFCVGGFFFFYNAVFMSLSVLFKIQ